MRWPWTRHRRQPSPPPRWSPPAPVPDGDRILGPRQQHWRQLRPDWATSRTQLLPVVTPAAAHRGRGADR